MNNPVVHFEILGTDGTALIEFYRGLFDWPVDKQALPGWPDYGIIEAPGQGLAEQSAPLMPRAVPLSSSMSRSMIPPLTLSER